MVRGCCRDRSEMRVDGRSTAWRRIACLTAVFYCVFQLAILGTVASKIDGGWDTEPNTQYHIQTDEGPERYFKYQTISGQYRKERRLQDGSVVGTYGWVDADGYLRLNDYVADSKGYRVVRNKKLFVGNQTPVGQAVSSAKYVPAVAGTAVTASPPYRSAPSAVTASPSPYRSAPAAAAVSSSPPYRATSGPAAPIVVDVTQAPEPVRQSSWRGSPFVYPSDSQSSPLRFPLSSSSTASPPSQQFRRRRPSTVSSTPAADYGYPAVRPVDVNSIADDDNGGAQPYRRRSWSTTTTTAEPPLYEQPLRPHTFRPAYRKVVDVSAEASEPAHYDGVSFVRNGFKYYLPRHYHEERSADGGETRVGSYGYVDPFGIRRVVYYNAAPGTGFVHRNNNRYVGLNAEPYDPRPQ